MPKKYVEKVGDDGFRKAPIGAGPYKFVSFTPGVELVLEAFDQYWRKPPSVKRLVLKVIPDEATRLAALKAGEVDIAYSIRGELAEQLQRIPGLTMKSVVLQGAFWLYFPEQWDPKSPWHDLRVRQAANLALDRKTINEALTLGYSHVTGSIMPDIFEFYWAPPTAGLRSGEGEAAAGRGRISEWLRRRLLHLRFLLREYRRGRARQPGADRHPREAASAGARGLHPGLRGQEVPEHHPGRAAARSAMSRRAWKPSW